MRVEAVLDTNVLLYAASKDLADQKKARIGLGLLAETDFGGGQDYSGVRVARGVPHF